ncbi:MAG: imidazole glycerol phosphate synthase subunit HisF [Microgenomates group bacterium]
MLAKRIIPCLDVKEGRVVKGVNFVGLTVSGNAIDLAEKYSNEGADELIFLDIAATNDKRKTVFDLVKEVSKKISIPFTIGGGIRSIEDMKRALVSGADKVAINSAAYLNKDLISQSANIFGSQCVVLAVDVKSNNGKWEVYINGGRIKINKYASEWIREAVEKGVGEILLTSIDRDGTKAGFDTELIRIFSDMVSVPIIASGGAGTVTDFVDVFENGNADGALAASIFHDGTISIKEVKKYLKMKNITVRI